MWSYYGAKTNIVKYYPPPKYGKIIEPFAGTARYALKYFDREVLLVDKYEVIVKIWKWLQKCSPQDILSLPRFIGEGKSLDDFKFDCEEAKMLMGFLIKKGIERPCLKPTKWTFAQRPNFTNFSLQRIASNLWKIKNWTIRHGSFDEIENQEATWFIDPPYQFGGNSYVHNKINFEDLGPWIKNRQGQIIACENTKATWMDFSPMISQKGTKRRTTEAIWTNEISAWNNQKQLQLI